MTYRSITEEEYKAISARTRGNLVAPEADALIALPLNQGLAFPCRWKHSGITAHCGGATLMHYTSYRRDFRVSTRCKEGTLYVWKLSKVKP